MRMLIAILLFASCSHDSMMLAKVNGEAITLGHFKSRLREIEFNPSLVASNDILELKKYILNEMIEEKIIQQQAQDMDVKVSPQEVDVEIKNSFSKEDLEKMDQNLRKQKISMEEWRERMRQRMLAQKIFENVTQNSPVATDEELNEFYSKNMKLFFQKEQVHIQQIAVQDKESARQIQQRILQGEDFLKIAQSLSTTENGALQGDLGFVPRGILPESVETKVFSMKPGTTSPILESAPNFYLVKLIEKRPQKQFEFEEARQQIQNMLLQSTKDKKYSAWLQEKLIQASIKRNDELLQENFSL